MLALAFHLAANSLQLDAGVIVELAGRQNFAGEVAKQGVEVADPGGILRKARKPAFEGQQSALDVGSFSLTHSSSIYTIYTIYTLKACATSTNFAQEAKHAKNPIK